MEIQQSNQNNCLYMATPFHFFSRAAIDITRLNITLPPRFSIQFTVREIGKTSLLDTFDEELRLSSKLLMQHQKHLFLFSQENSGLVAQPCPLFWRFVTDLDDGPIKKSLAGVSPLRALLPRHSTSLKTKQLALVDDEEKTHARANVYECENDETVVTFGQTHPLKGYNRGHRLLVNALTQQGVQYQGEIDELYELLGVDIQNPYTAKPTVTLDPEASIQETTRSLINSYIQVARHNEAGIQADYDTEFLHDYRVSLRKVRSVLSLFKGVYGEDDTIRLKESFSEIMKQTNRLRDLDVYLLDKADYLSMVPGSMTGGLALMFTEFTKERQQQLQHVISTLQSESYLRTINKLVEQFSDPGALVPGEHAHEPTRPFARRLIWKRYKKVCKIARHIDETTPYEEVHTLRIQCKKLRYLMEFFAPLFPKGTLKALIKDLKRLQDNLGRFNDFSVQQLSLQEFLREHSPKRQSNIDFAQSIGALITVLHQRQLTEREQVMANFSAFDSPKTRAAFQSLFHQESSL